MAESCPTCRVRLRRLSPQYPVWVCRLCGTLVHGEGEVRQTVTPAIIGPLSDGHGQCLRDDRDECVVYLTARQAVRNQ